jgi:hypothetical protein
MSDQERRQFTRFPFDGKISFSHDGTEYNAALVDISLKGALITLDEEWLHGRADDIDFSLLIHEQSIEIKFQGNIVHIEGKQVGVSCEHIDIESASHLKRLVELNLGDSLLLARELSAMC